MTDDANKRFRRIRSFVRRPGRMTSAQERALTELLPKFDLDPATPDARRAFADSRPLVVEIGCGNGQALVAMASNEPQFNFLGIEVHEPGVGRLVQAIDQAELDNVRVAMRDAVEVFEQQIVPASLEQVRIYFPDPWHKKRHHKRRLIQTPFLEILAERICHGGLLHLATDWMPYAEWMIEALEQVPAFELVGAPYVPCPDWRPQTHFERRGKRRGHSIVDILARRARA